MYSQEYKGNLNGKSPPVDCLLTKIPGCSNGIRAGSSEGRMVPPEIFNLGWVVKVVSVCWVAGQIM